MFSVTTEGDIFITQGDTGSFRVKCWKTDGTGFHNDSEHGYDRALVTINTEPRWQMCYPITQNSDGTWGYTVSFNNSDTQDIPAGSYAYDIRYILHAIFPENDPTRIPQDGLEVRTPGDGSNHTVTIYNAIGKI